MNKKNAVLICMGLVLLGIAGLYVVLKVVKWPLQSVTSKPDETVTDIPHEELKPETDGKENIL